VRGTSRAWVGNPSGEAAAEPQGRRRWRGNRLLLSLALCACGRAAPEREAARAPEPALKATAPAGEIPLAQVGETGIYRSQLVAHARATGLAPQPALDDLIAQELLFQEAARRGLTRDEDVLYARAQALVRLFVPLEFGRGTASPEAIPESDARPVYDKLHDYFNHGPMLRVWNVCTTPEQAHAIDADARAHPAKTAEDFQAIARAHGADAQYILTATDSLAYEAPWRKALFQALHKPGDVMHPTPLPQLRFPCTTHVAWCQEALPARHDSFEQALPEIRQRIYEDWRRKAFRGFSNRLLRAHRVEQHPERLPAQ
jgi:hypothetical protein